MATITFDTFVRNISDLVKFSSDRPDTDHTWTLEAENEETYASLKFICKENNSVTEVDPCIPNEDLSTLNFQSGNELVYKYHVLYSHIYSVPVLYFNVNHTDGKLVPLSRIWECVPTVFKNELDAHKWTMITQKEHPIFGQPFYQLHPCHTADLMKKIVKSGLPKDASQIAREVLMQLSVNPSVHTKMTTKPEEMYKEIEEMEELLHK